MQEEVELGVLESLAARSSDLDRLTSVPPEFNVFEVMGTVFQELRHSDFLAFLLNPQASHGLGDRFTRGWLQGVVSSARDHYAEDVSAISGARLEPLKLIDLSRAQVFRERDHIDVLLVDATNRFTVVVENKISSGEHSDQLARYRQCVEERYPGFDLLCIFLTPEGEAPSRGSGYIPADYGLVCEEVETIVEEGSLPDGTPIDPEVSFALSHYARMLRRNIVANSETIDLARRLYLEHKTAFDLVYAHRYSHQRRLRKMLIGLIEETPEITYGGKTGNPPYEWIIFYPEEWEVPVLRCAREDYRKTGPIISFVFDNYLDSLDLKLEFGLGDDEVRRRILEMAHEAPELFAAAPPAPNPEWVTTIWRFPLLTREAYLEGTDSFRECLLRERWDIFLKEAFPRLSDTIGQQQWIWNTDAKS